MAFNVRPGGLAESVPVVEAVNSGDVVRVASFVGIAQIDAELGRDGVWYTTLALEGIAHGPLTGAVTVGQPIYTATASAAGSPGVVATLTTAVTAGNKLVGIATRAKGSGAGQVFFKLVPNATVTV